MVKFAYLAVAGGMALLMAACNSTGGSTLGPVDSSSLVGKWQIKSVHAVGSTETKMAGMDTVERTDTTMTYANPDYYMEFKADKSCTLSVPPDAGNTPMVEPCTWSLNGNTLTTTVTGMPAPSHSQVGINGSTLTDVTTVDTTMSIGPMTMTMHSVNTATATKM